MFSLAPDHAVGLLPRYVTQRYRRMAIRLKLRSTRLHALRHYSATELLAAGVDLRTVAGRLGHGGGTTLKTYAAWVEQADHQAPETIATIVPRPQPLPREPRGPYESIADALRDDIASGRLTAGRALPTVVQLAAQFNVAAGTAHRAMATLAAEGLIQVTRGRRAVVKAVASDEERLLDDPRSLGYEDADWRLVGPCASRWFSSAARFASRVSRLWVRIDVVFTGSR